jgi:hypothetical protein
VDAGSFGVHPLGEGADWVTMMNRDDDQIYYQRRARQERERAERSSDSAISSVHRKLASEYERRIVDNRAQQ